MSIDKFINANYFLSLDYPFEYTLYGITFKNLAQYYYGFKCNFIAPMERITKVDMSPENYIEKLHPSLLRPDWLEVRQKILNHGIYTKFNDPELQQKLLNTGDEELIYGFTQPHPTDELLYLGKSLVTGEGENQLGKQLMETRQYYKTLKIHTLVSVDAAYSNLQ